ncbi:MAG: TonB-dependent receptor plug domain-containing protein, partial [Bacteroidetes bacterium]|nr:TonB-dependent receptor plug domain-containing protein [Bacteroidota bacterium]
FYHTKKEIDIQVGIDSIQFSYSENDIEKSKYLTIEALDNFGNATKVFSGYSPCKIELNHYYSKYMASMDSLSKSIQIASESSMLNCYTERTKDSIYFEVDNPRKIPFSYNIYKRNRQKGKGYSDSLNIANKVTSKQNYFISIRYLWGGKIKEDNYRIPFVEKRLNLSMTYPKLVYPGQKARIELKVTDIAGDPVEDVDVTAYSVTKKFNHYAPPLPDFEKERKNKTIINNFDLGKVNLNNHPGLKLDYEAWKILAGLDTIEYYKFLYPGDSIYRFEYGTGDLITQFAPFVVSEGSLQPIHVIYVDSRPVYFSWSTHTQPYSFRVSKGYHRIKLRTVNKSITIDSLYFNAGRKLIFSVKDNLSLKNTVIHNEEPELSKYEKSSLYRYVFPYRYNFGEKYAYLQDNGEIQFLKPLNSRKNGSQLAGPVVGYTSMHVIDGYSTNFKHEPLFEYEFAPQLLKMRSMDPDHYPQTLLDRWNRRNFRDTVLTKKALEKKWETHISAKRYQQTRYDNPRSTKSGRGKLQYEFKVMENTSNNIPLNLLVFQHEYPQFLRVYPGNIRMIHNLEEGVYQLIFFYPGNAYHIVDSLMIEKDGLNYYQLPEPEAFTYDTFGLGVSNLIMESLSKDDKLDSQNNKYEIRHEYRQQFSYFWNGNAIEGYVHDAKNGEPVIGVNVLVKGTMCGTTTDFDGYYFLKLPPDKYELRFSHIGYNPQDIILGYDNILNVNMEEGVLLDEVVVVRHRVVSQKQSSSGSVSFIPGSKIRRQKKPKKRTKNSGKNQGLAEKMPGMKIFDEETVAGIVIRGHSSLTSGNSPIYVVDGVVYNGDEINITTNMIGEMQMLKGAEATAIYGSAANGVILITTKKGAELPEQLRMNKGADYDADFFEAASQASSIRDNFSDYAFWQPTLRTDKNGKAAFEVTFPDDVTSWQTYFLAMNGKKQSGKTSGLIKSYKPLMAQLAVPRFLVQSDTTFVIGKVLNYTPDTISVNTRFELSGEIEFSKNQTCTHSLIDTLEMVAVEDSISLKYILEKEDGYFDGEIREIPVFPIGMEDTKGSFHVFDRDTSILLSFDTTLGDVKLYAKSDMLNVIEVEIDRLRKYKYLCNEQLASKLKGLLALKTIAEYKNQKFKYDKDIEKLIQLLNNNKGYRGLWGWWNSSSASYWISQHVFEALVKARRMGFSVEIDAEKIAEKHVWRLENPNNFRHEIRLLKLLALLNAPVDYEKYIAELEKRDSSFFG